MEPEKPVPGAPNRECELCQRKAKNSEKNVCKDLKASCLTAREFVDSMWEKSLLKERLALKTQKPAAGRLGELLAWAQTSRACGAFHFLSLQPTSEVHVMLVG